LEAIGILLAAEKQKVLKTNSIRLGKGLVIHDRGFMYSAKRVCMNTALGYDYMTKLAEIVITEKGGIKIRG